LVNLAKELHIEDKVRFEGFKTKPDIVKEMAQADIFVLTSATAPDGDQEGLPVSLIEAQAMSLPVVATSHSGIPELVINHETGLLAPEKAVDQISAHMRALVSDVKLRITLGEKGRRRVQDEFNISQLNDRLFNCLTKHIDLPIQADEFFKTTHINAQFDVIMVWYQNDWGLYGRRNEMLARYLIKHPQIRKVIHLEPPLNMDMLEDSSTPATFDSNLDVNLARTREVVDSEVVLFTPHFHTGMTPAEIKSAVTQQVHDLISAHQLQNVILWLYPPHWFTNLMLDQFGATAQMIISDCVSR
jgi:hypothetical protein